MHPNDDVYVRIPSDSTTISIIKNIVLGNFKTVVNGVFKHPELRSEIPSALNRNVSEEFKQYVCKSDSALKGTSPDQLSAFSNKFVIEESKACCPLWHACLTGACNSTDKDRKYSSLALATSVVARARNPTMSATAYRISAILNHGGLSYDDLRRLNRLGICMSPDRGVDLQRKMGVNFDHKIQVWRKSIECNKRQLLFLEEVREKQVPDYQPDDMELVTCWDFSYYKLSKKIQRGSTVNPLPWGYGFWSQPTMLISSPKGSYENLAIKSSTPEN